MKFRRKMRFDDVDWGRVIYFPRLFDFVYQAMEDWYWENDISIKDMIREEHIGAPIVEAHSRFVGPSFYEDEIEIELAMRDVSSTGFRVLFEVTNLTRNQPMARGYVRERFTQTRPFGPTDAPDHVLEPFRKLEQQTRDVQIDV